MKLKRIIICLIVMAMLMQISACGRNQSKKGILKGTSNVTTNKTETNAAYEKSAEAVDKELKKVVETDKYQSGSTPERAEILKKELEKLAKNDPLKGNAYVKKDSISYSEEFKQISYEDAEGTFCFYPLEKEESTELECLSEVKEHSWENMDLLHKKTAKVVNNNFAELLTKKEETNNSQNKILLVTNFYDDVADSIKQMEMFKDSLENCGIKANITVMEADLEKMRNGLKKESYDFIGILCHGYETSVRSKSTCTMGVYTKNTDKNDKMFKNDKAAKRIIKMTFTDKYYLTGDFFSYYYPNNELKNSIIHMSSCCGMGTFNYITGKGKEYHELSNGLLSTGAGAVVGHINKPMLMYDLAEMHTEIAALSCGYNIEEALLQAYKNWGSTDYMFYNNYSDTSIAFDKETATTEIRGDKTSAFTVRSYHPTDTLDDVAEAKRTVEKIYVKLSDCEKLKFEYGGLNIEFMSYPQGYIQLDSADGFYFTKPDGTPVLSVVYHGETEAEIDVLQPIGTFQILATTGPDNLISMAKISACINYRDGKNEDINLNAQHYRRGETGVYFYSLAVLENGKYIEFLE